MDLSERLRGAQLAGCQTKRNLPCFNLKEMATIPENRAETKLCFLFKKNLDLADKTLQFPLINEKKTDGI